MKQCNLIAIHSHCREKSVHKFWTCSHLYMMDCLCFPAETLPAVWKFLCKKKRQHSHEEPRQLTGHLAADYINVYVVPCIWCQAAKHVREGRQSKSSSLLYQERVLIRCLLSVVLECHTLPPQPVKLALFKLVPHWEHTGNRLPLMFKMQIQCFNFENLVTVFSAINNYYFKKMNTSHKHPPRGALMWSKEATKCRLGRDASCPRALWVFSPRSIGPSMLWMSKYTWRSGPVRICLILTDRL